MVIHALLRVYCNYAREMSVLQTVSYDGAHENLVFQNAIPCELRHIIGKSTGHAVLVIYNYSKSVKYPA